MKVNIEEVKGKLGRLRVTERSREKERRIKPLFQKEFRVSKKQSSQTTEEFTVGFFFP